VNKIINIFNTANELADKLAITFYDHVRDLCLKKSKITIALSGGHTPELLFKKIAARLPSPDALPDLSKVHFFWGDERCVPPHHPDSNYRMANLYLLRALHINESNVHRIRGERKPEEEILRYREDILQHVTLKNGVPVFDWIFLGMGDDGHTASIFPDQMSLLHSDELCAAAVHPLSGQQRITFTGKTIINARLITFLVTGRRKSKIIKEIMNDEPVAKLYPASYIKPLKGKLEWYLDKEAAGGI